MSLPPDFLLLVELNFRLTCKGIQLLLGGDLIYSENQLWCPGPRGSAPEHVLPTHQRGGEHLSCVMFDLSSLEGTDTKHPSTAQRGYSP